MISVISTEDTGALALANQGSFSERCHRIMTNSNHRNSIAKKRLLSY